MPVDHSVTFQVEDKCGIEYVRPSKQLLDFYRKKIIQYENEHDIVVKKLSEYSKSHEDEHYLECEVKQRDEEIAELQKALTDMQLFLFKEREQVLQLYTENDTFKARELENKRTVQQLLALRGSSVEGEVSYFFKEPPQHPIIPDKTSYKDSQNPRFQASKKGKSTKFDSSTSRLKELEKPDQVTLGLQVEALQSQIADQERWAREFLEAINEDQKIKAEEHETRSERDLEKVKTITQKLHKTQDLLYESTQDTLKMRQAWTENELRWRSEKNKLMMQLTDLRGRLNGGDFEDTDYEPAKQTTNNSHITLKIDNSAKYRAEAKKLRTELEGIHKMSEMYRKQVMSLEDDIAGYKEKEHLTTDAYQNKVENMSKRYQIMKIRYEDLEKRRNLEVEGFKNDIKSLRKQLKDMERQLYKATVECGGINMADQTADIDLAVLNRVRKTTSKSLQLNKQLKGVKERVYSIEDDMRHL
ncbi:CCDC77 [Bugula neritina]|uniref:CCDC77 n=1 Tax=Bugula neritina TaxID=10212 RepID=A0A7J7J4C4_BUGNE|nr:CCDC77 [Bugula neritina]